MARKKKHEDHPNHEAWAIPYGDLITLLLAFFVVMYSISSVNEGKYRVLSDALSEAFHGSPRSLKPVQFGTKQQRGSDHEEQMNLLRQDTIEQSVGGTMRELRNPSVYPAIKIHTQMPGQQGVGVGAGFGAGPGTGAAGQGAASALKRIGDEIEQAMGELIHRKLVTVRHTDLTLEVEIGTDILFASGSADIDETARPVLGQLAAILHGFPNPMRIEGHTDTVPIRTAAFPSNWELSAARAASVVHLFMEQGVEPRRMSVAGFGEFHPAADNDTPEGRNRNRRVVIVVLEPQGVPVTTQLSQSDAAPVADGEAVAASASGADAGVDAFTNPLPADAATISSAPAAGGTALLPVAATAITAVAR
jgi:chemotaxis protein MotB